MTINIRSTTSGTHFDAAIVSQLVLHTDGSIRAPYVHNVRTDDTVATVGIVKQFNGNMFEIGMWMGDPQSLPEGRFALNGQQVPELLVPGLQAAIIATGQPNVPAAQWLSYPSEHCGKFGLGDGFTILPDWMGTTTGALGKLYFAGGGDVLRGTVASDKIRNITGTFVGYDSGDDSSGTWSGAFAKVGSSAMNSGGVGNTGEAVTDFDASRMVPTGPENIPKTVYGTWMITLYGSFTGLLEYDVAAHAAVLSDHENRISVLEDKSDNVRFLYPNGGTAAAPANVVNNWRGVLDNPWPGYHVTATVFLFVGGEWGESGWDGNAGTGTVAYGAKAGYNSTLDKVVIQTGSSGVATGNNQTGAVHGSALMTTAPCYIMVEKKGKRNI